MLAARSEREEIKREAERGRKMGKSGKERKIVVERERLSGKRENEIERERLENGWADPR